MDLLLCWPSCCLFTWLLRMRSELGFFQRGWAVCVWKKPGFLLAIKPAIDRINNDTSILPRDHLTFLWADSQCKTRYAAEAAAWLLASEVDVIIGSPCSGDCELFVPMVTYKHVPVISYYAVSPVLSNKQVYPAFARVVGTTVFYDRLGTQS